MRGHRLDEGEARLPVVLLCRDRRLRSGEGPVIHALRVVHRGGIRGVDAAVLVRGGIRLDIRPGNFSPGNRVERGAFVVVREGRPLLNYRALEVGNDSSECDCMAVLGLVREEPVAFSVRKIAFRCAREVIEAHTLLGVEPVL